MKALKFLFAVMLILTLTVPALAGNGAGPGGPRNTPTPITTVAPTEEPGGGDVPDTGELYGDLYVIFRDVDGIPILDATGCIQPIAAITDSTIVTTYYGEITISATEGEPFQLATYYDLTNTLVECELTADMADWVIGVDFGRLNLGRAPDSVIAHALDEATNKMNTALEISLDPAGRLVMLQYNLDTVDILDDLVEKTIDAPAEALALYIEMMKYGDWILDDTTPIVMGGPPDGKGPSEGDGPSAEPRPVLNDSAIGHLLELGFVNLVVSDTITSLSDVELNLAASLLAAAADKGTTITLDKVVYINSIYGINQVGSLINPVTGNSYYDFRSFAYGRDGVYANRGDDECSLGWVYVLQPESYDVDGDPVTLHYITTCMDILGYEAAHDTSINSVRFTDMEESYDTVTVDGAGLIYSFENNVRGFAQAADDALQVIEYIHNYKVPVVLYP